MFDIDKLFISMKHYQRVFDEDRSTDKEIHHKTTDVFDKDTNPEEYYCNMLIDNYLALLKDDRVFNQLNGPIDSDTELLTSIVDDLEEGNDPLTLKPYQVSTLSFQSGTKDKFVTGKVGIGPFALNNNNHILTMLYGVKFKESFSSILTKLGLTDLSSAMDRDGKSIMSWLSGLINAHVDVAKDPYISKLNVNSYTYNLVNLLVRTGLGKTTFYFTTQPIMKQLASVYNTASGVYMIEEGLSKSKAQEKAVEDAILHYVEANTGKKHRSMSKALSDFATTFTSSHDISVTDAIARLFDKDCNILHDIAKGGSIEYLENKRHETYTLQEGITLSMYEVQMLVAIANNEFKDPAEKLSDVVKYSKIDTKKQGKNIPEMYIYSKGVQRTFESMLSDYTFENIGNFFTKSYIAQKTRNAINLVYDILGSQTITATRQFNDIIYKLMHPQRNVNTEKDFYSLATVNKTTKAVLAQVKAKFFFDPDTGYCKQNKIGIKSLIDGKDSIYNRLLRLKAQIMSQPEYVEYRDNSGNPINYLLQVLTSGYVSDVKQGVFDNAKFVQIASITQSDEINPQEIINAWEDMLNDDQHPEMKQFAKDLIIYAFLTSSDNGGNKDLFKYVPNSWKIDSGYVDYMADALEKFQNGTYEFTDDDFRDVILSNADDDSFVRPVKAEKVTILTSDNGEPSILAGFRIGKSQQLVGNKVEERAVIKFTYESISAAPQYVKIKYIDGVTKQEVQYVFVKTDEGVINDKRYPIYTRVNPRTTKFKLGNYVYGYGFNAKVDSKVSSENNKEFNDRVAEQMRRARTTIDEQGHLAPSAYDNIELAVAQSIIAARTQDSREAAPEAPIAPERSRSVWSRSETSYTRVSVQNDPQTLYIFTDNTDRTSGGQPYGEGWYKEKYGEGGFGSMNNPTTAQIRGLENAAPISTMRYFYRLHEGMTVADARWKDSDIEEFKKVIDSEIEDIKKLWDSGRFTKIVSPAGDGFFNSKIAQISKDSEIGKYLNSKLKELYNYVNSTRNNTLTTPKQLSEVEEQLGRKIITPSNIPFMTEQLQISVGGKQYDQQTLNRFLRVQNQIVDILFGKNIPINKYISITYADWKRMLQINYDIFGEKSSNQLEYFVENRLLPVLQDSDFVNENDERYHNYDKKSKLITIPLVEYELINLLSNNPDYLQFLNQLSLDSSLEDILTIMQDKYENVSDMVTSIATTTFEDGFEEQITEGVQDSLEERGINISFSYTDSRQMEIDFDDSDQSDEMINKCKG